MVYGAKSKILSSDAPTGRKTWLLFSVKVMCMGRLAKCMIRAYKKAQRTGSPADWTRYQNLKTSTQREIRTSHRNYMKGMVTSDQKDKPKLFWNYVKAKKQESTRVAPFRNEDRFIHSNSQSKNEILNAQFQSVYTKEDLSFMPDKGPSPYLSMDSILSNTKGVHKQLSQLNTRKARGQPQYYDWLPMN